MAVGIDVGMRWRNETARIEEGHLRSVDRVRFAEDESQAEGFYVMKSALSENDEFVTHCLCTAILRAQRCSRATSPDRQPAAARTLLGQLRFAILAIPGTQRQLSAQPQL